MTSTNKVKYFAFDEYLNFRDQGLIPENNKNPNVMVGTFQGTKEVALLSIGKDKSDALLALANKIITGEIRDRFEMITQNTFGFDALRNVVKEQFPELLV